MNTVDASEGWTAKYVRNVCIQEKYIELMQAYEDSKKKKKKEPAGKSLPNSGGKLPPGRVTAGLPNSRTTCVCIVNSPTPNTFLSWVLFFLPSGIFSQGKNEEQRDLKVQRTEGTGEGRIGADGMRLLV